MKNNRRVALILGAGLIALCICPIATGLMGYLAYQNPTVNSFVNEVTGMFGDMLELQQAIASEFPAENVQVQIRNGHILVITLVNSSYNELSDEEQRDQAEVIAHYAYTNYGSISTVDQIHINFVQSAQALGVSANVSRAYVFETSELALEP